MSPKINEIDTILTSLQKRQFHPLYLFHGQEDFLIDEAVSSLIENALEPASRSFNLDVVYGGDVTVQDVVAFASAFPMASDLRVVVVRDAEKIATSESKRELLLRYLENPVRSTILVFIATKVDMRLRIFKAIQERGVAAEFRPLNEHRIPDWIQRRVARMKRKITYDASELLLAHVGISLRDIRNELDKLMVYIGEKKTIESEDVSAVVGVSRAYNVFELQKAVARGDAHRTMEILEHVLEAGESAIGIIAILTRFFQKVWILSGLRPRMNSDVELASALQINPYFIREYVGALQRFAGSKLNRVFGALLEADARLKSTGEDPRIVMTTLMYQLLNPAPEVTV